VNTTQKILIKDKGNANLEKNKITLIFYSEMPLTFEFYSKEDKKTK